MAGHGANTGSAAEGCAASAAMSADELFLESSMSEGGATLAPLASSSGSAFLSTHFFFSSSQTMELSVSFGRCA